MLVCYESILAGESSGLLGGVICSGAFVRVLLVAVTGLLLFLCQFTKNSIAHDIKALTIKHAGFLSPVFWRFHLRTVTETHRLCLDLTEAILVAIISVNGDRALQLANQSQVFTTQPGDVTRTICCWPRSENWNCKIARPLWPNQLIVGETENLNFQLHANRIGDYVPVIFKPDTDDGIRIDKRHGRGTQGAVSIEAYDSGLTANQLLSHQSGLLLYLVKGILHRYSLLSSFIGVPPDSDQGQKVNHEFQPTRNFISHFSGALLMGYGL